MSPEARTALYNIGTRRQGTPVPANTPADVIEELRVLGLIGRTNGLTRKGSIKREIIVNEELDKAFS